MHCAMVPETVQHLTAHIALAARSIPQSCCAAKAITCCCTTWWPMSAQQARCDMCPVRFRPFQDALHGHPYPLCVQKLRICGQHSHGAQHLHVRHLGPARFLQIAPTASVRPTTARMHAAQPQQLRGAEQPQHVQQEKPVTQQQSEHAGRLCPSAAGCTQVAAPSLAPGSHLSAICWGPKRPWSHDASPTSAQQAAPSGCCTMRSICSS